MVETMPPDSAKTYSEMFRVAARALDLEDLNHAMSGAEVGRQRRHIRDKDIDPQTGEKGKGRSGAVQRTLDWLLLNDHDYAVAHRGLMSAIREAQQSTQHAYARIEEALTLERSLLDELKSNAARLPDGALVFKDNNGQVRSADGEIVPAELAEGIEWHGDEPSFEDYQAQRNRVDDLERARDEILGIERELGEIHARGSNNDAPLTPEEIERNTERAQGLRERAGEIAANVESRVNARVETDLSADENGMDIGKKSNVELPPINIGG